MIEPKDIVVSFRTNETMNKWLKDTADKCKVSKGLLVYALLEHSITYFKDKQIELMRKTELEVK
jgi:hypothetical protein|nr:MAG TPA: hypothetical protein [Caudoviricetes sp.]